MDCLRYLLLLLEQGHKFKIFYNSNHCCGVNKNKMFDLDNGFKKDMLLGYADMYLPLEQCHNKETVIKIFNLDERYSKILDEYYLF